jgi:hypothetical protein
VTFFLFSSPEPKAQGELLVSKGDALASVIRRHASTIVFFSETAINLLSILLILI